MLFRSFRMACKRFIYLENLGGAGAEPAQAVPKKEEPSRGVELVESALSDVEDEDGWAELGRVGTQLGQRYPDFDPRSYGYRKLIDLIRATGRYEIRSEGNAHYVRSKPRK